jgi:hypothetical protein
LADRRLFDPDAIPEFHGPGPAATYLPQYAAREELWRYTLSLVEDPTRHWCEFGVGEGETLDWFASRKPRQNTLFAFDSFEGIPEPWLVYPAGHWRTRPYVSNRGDVIVVPGLFGDSLTTAQVDAIGVAGLVHIDCDLYASTRTVLDRIGPGIQRGTVLVFDEFYNYFGWEDHEFRAFMEFAIAERLQFEYLGRTPSCQVSLRVMARGFGVGATVRACDWTPMRPGIGIRGGRHRAG